MNGIAGKRPVDQSGQSITCDVFQHNSGFDAVADAEAMACPRFSGCEDPLPFIACQESGSYPPPSNMITFAFHIFPPAVSRDQHDYGAAGVIVHCPQPLKHYGAVQRCAPLEVIWTHKYNPFHETNPARRFGVWDQRFTRGFTSFGREYFGALVDLQARGDGFGFAQPAFQACGTREGLEKADDIADFGIAHADGFDVGLALQAGHFPGVFEDDEVDAGEPGGGWQVGHVGLPVLEGAHWIEVVADDTFERWVGAIVAVGCGEFDIAQ